MFSNCIMNVYYTTVATKNHPILQNIIKKINKNKEKMYILGLQENRYIGWNAKGNFGVKLKEVHQFIFQENMKPNDIVIFTDAFDVIYSGTLRDISERFLQMNSPLVFGCETTCNPDPERHVQYKKKDVEFPYLNSGMFIGHIWALRECMQNYTYNDSHDDQRFWTTQFFEKPHLFKLDYENELFLNTYGVDLNNIIWLNETCIYKGKTPTFIHVNGPNKNDLQKFL